MGPRAPGSRLPWPLRCSSTAPPPEPTREKGALGPLALLQASGLCRVAHQAVALAHPPSRWQPLHSGINPACSCLAPLYWRRAGDPLSRGSRVLSLGVLPSRLQHCLHPSSSLTLGRCWAGACMSGCWLVHHRPDPALLCNSPSGIPGCPFPAPGSGPCWTQRRALPVPSGALGVVVMAGDGSAPT